MKEVVLKKSTNPQKKYDAFINNKKVSFGLQVPLMKGVTHTSNGTVPHNRGQI